MNEILENTLKAGEKPKYVIATLTCENGFTWTTRVCGTGQTAKDYFLGNIFNTGAYPAEVMSKCVKCETKELC